MRFIALAALILAAKIAGNAQDVSILPYPLPVAQYDAVKRHLGLTDAQLNSLTSIATTRTQAQSNLYRQISEKNTALNALLASGSTDAARIGQLMIEINLLRKQTVPVEPYRSQALNLLSPDQKLKLPLLVQALQLQTASWQATSLNLIDNPNATGTPRILPVTSGLGVIGTLPVPDEPNN